MEKSKKGCEECFEIQNINLEDNAPPVTEKEASTEIKQAVPLLLQTLRQLIQQNVNLRREIKNGMMKSLMMI